MEISGSFSDDLRDAVSKLIDASNSLNEYIYK